MDKINYHLRFLDEIKSFENNKKPSLLMHVCCGPCSCYPLTVLCPHFDVTLYFNNSNIFPSEEYYRRLEELKTFLKEFEKDYGYKVNLIVTEYKNEEYMKDLWPLKDEPECGKRCELCYSKRMDEAFNYADKNNYEYFTTVMTISRQKSSQTLNRIGEELAKKYTNTKYLFSDFKKDDGIRKGREIRDKYNMYQQTYCGCEISYKIRKAWDESKK